MASAPDLPPLREVVAALGLDARRSLGQHFLFDLNLTRRIARAAAPLAGRTIVEIGPGPGALTRSLLAQGAGRVLAIEKDARFLPALAAIAEAYPGRLDVLNADALDVDARAHVHGPAKIVANLPYNVATPLVVESLERVPSLERWCVMVQREVSDRFFASPRTKAYGAVSVLVQLHARKVGFHPVPPTVFRPRPRVESALVAFVRVPGPPLGEVRPVVDAAFAHRRKTLPNSVSLSGLATRARAEEALSAIGKSPGVRAEELAPEEFVALAEALA